MICPVLFLFASCVNLRTIPVDKKVAKRRAAFAIGYIERVGNAHPGALDKSEATAVFSVNDDSVLFTHKAVDVTAISDFVHKNDSLSARILRLGAMLDSTDRKMAAALALRDRAALRALAIEKNGIIKTRAKLRARRGLWAASLRHKIINKIDTVLLDTLNAVSARGDTIKLFYSAHVLLDSLGNCTLAIKQKDISARMREYKGSPGGGLSWPYVILILIALATTVLMLYLTARRAYK